MRRPKPSARHEPAANGGAPNRRMWLDGRWKRSVMASTRATLATCSADRRGCPCNQGAGQARRRRDIRLSSSRQNGRRCLCRYPRIGHQARGANGRRETGARDDPSWKRANHFVRNLVEKIRGRAARPWPARLYALPLAHGVWQAIHCGHDRLATVELGVYTGKGLLDLCKAAAVISRRIRPRHPGIAASTAWSGLSPTRQAITAIILNCCTTPASSRCPTTTRCAPVCHLGAN